MKLSIGKKIGIGFAIALAALVVIGAMTSVNLQRVEEDSHWVTHTVEVKNDTTAFLAAMLHAESYSRGYQLSPTPEAKRASEASARQAEHLLRTLADLTADNPTQVANVAQVRTLMAARLAASRQLIQLRDRAAGGDGSLDLRQQAVVQEGRQEMSGLEEALRAMTAEEDRLLLVRQQKSAATGKATWDTIVYGTIAAFMLVTLAGYLVTRGITVPLRDLGVGAGRIGRGEYSHRVSVDARDEVGVLAGLFNAMAAQVEERQASLAEQDWLKSGVARFAVTFQGERDPLVLCQQVLKDLAAVLDARHSVIYLPQETPEGIRLRLRASYAADNPPEWLKPGEGLAGQAYADRQRAVVREIPPGFLRIHSALGESPPAEVVIVPAVYENQVKAVIELATWKALTPIQLDLLDHLGESLGVVLNTIEAGLRTEELLRQSQTLAQNLRSSELELQEQQEELKQTNEELEQTNEEMQQTNEEMEEKVQLLAEQKKQLEKANLEIDRARAAVEDKASQVAQASKYKSDFLASMSHELRTPLNSMLILSKILSDNGESNLSAKQVQYAETIYSSGNDLLELINEILDLSKIESGAVEVEARSVNFPELRQFLADSFGPVAESKHLGFELQFDPKLPGSIETDERRLHQVLKNLLSNAFKFTEKGSVTLRAAPAAGGWDPACATLNQAAEVIAFSVTDTGIGIPADKQKLIFEAFQQGDAGTARKYGGTGLGLSISREIAALLGGAISVASEPGSGSTFTVYLPARRSAPAERKPGKAPAAPAAAAPLEPDPEGVPDDRAGLQQGDLVLLVIEDDPDFARIIVDFAREKRFKVVVARTAARGVALARQLKPSAITLDLRLPDSDGSVVLDRLKHDPLTRHIPVHVISVEEGGEHNSLRSGAVSYIQKPVTKESLEWALSSTIEFLHRPIKQLMVVEDDAVQRQALTDLIGGADVQITAAGSAADALAAADQKRFDCIVIDLGLPDMAGLQVIRELQRRHGAQVPPIIVYTGKQLTREEETQLRLVSDSIVVKSARSPERLLDETALFLHRIQSRLPDPSRRLIEKSQKNDSVLAGRKVLVVDDDVRNIFAITSALEAAQMQVCYAESGAAGIEMLKSEPGIEAVLMDVMMPEMDGFEATRLIRQMPQFKKLPIISVTAKAMRGDREKCLEAGASDYITKPVDMDQLRSLLRVWLYR